MAQHTHTPEHFRTKDLPRFIPGSSRTCWSPLASPAEMRAWDTAAGKDFGLSMTLLMENAAREAFHVLCGLYGGPEQMRSRRALVFAGSGNNGGDAVALARNLRDVGCSVALIHTRPLGKMRGAAAEHLRMALKCGVFCLPAKRWLEGAKKNIIWPENYAKSCFPKAVALPDIIIDGLVGSGFTPPLDASLTELVLAINCLKDHSTILALDSPSGLDKNGLPAPVAIAAKHTVSFQTQKLNLILPSAREYSGVVHLRSVGIPLLAQEALPTRMRVLEPACLGALPGPAPDLHKGKAGRVLIIGGTPGLTGAPVLAAMGALRGGAGLVTIACPAGLALEIKSGLPDIMTLPVGTGSDWDLSCLPLLLERAGDCDALVLGPGLGRSAGALSVVQGFLRQTQDVPGKRAPAVIDADALYALSINKDYLSLPAGNDILTPHPLEMARLLEGCENANAGNVLEDRPGSLDAFIKKCKAAITLKGPCSLITQAGRSVYVSPIAAPCLAVGGSGDVLSGLLAALLAQRIPPLPAACLGVYWHGQAGILLEKDYPCRGNSAREIADMLPKVRLL